MKGNSMKPEALQKIARTLQKSHHQHLGITRQPPKPPHAPPAARLERPDLLAFSNALDNACAQWPDSDLCLIGADGALAPTNIDDPTDTLPAGFLQFLDPEMLMPLPIGDPEDQGDQID
jgi:hypothetical protein